jgi:hypothetical protein
LALELRKPTDKGIPEDLPAGVEGFLRPDRRHDHMQDGDYRGDFASAITVADVLAGLFDHPVGHQIADRIETDRLESGGNPCRFLCGFADTLLTHTEVSLPIAVVPIAVVLKTTIGSRRPLFLRFLTDRHSGLSLIQEYGL